MKLRHVSLNTCYTLNMNFIDYFILFTVNRAISMTEESDTDSDVLFENQNKSNGTQHRNGLSAKSNNQKSYVTTRLGRRIKA